MGTSVFESDEGQEQDLGSGGKLETVDTSPAAAAPAPEPANAAQKPSAHGAMYTVLARQGVNVAQLLNTALGQRTFGKLTPRRLEVAAPIGQSTQGGKKARQSVTLIPVSGDGPALMCGWLDAAQRLADFRDYDDVAEQFKHRFGGTFEVTEAEYASLIRDVERMLHPLGFQIVEEEDEDARPAPRARKKPARAAPGPANGTWKTVAWIVGAAVVGAVIVLGLS